MKPGRYRHFKGGEYELISIASHSETMEPMVVYKALYGEADLWVRPAAMWNEHVSKDGYDGPRFTYIEEENVRAAKLQHASDCRETPVLFRQDWGFVRNWARK